MTTTEPDTSRERTIALIGAPTDIGAGHRGGSMGPEALRVAGLQAETDYQGRSLRALFKAAPKWGVRLMLVLGPEEVQNNSVQVRDLAHSQDLTLPTDDALPGELRKLLVQ